MEAGDLVVDGLHGGVQVVGRMFGSWDGGMVVKLWKFKFGVRGVSCHF